MWCAPGNAGIAGEKLASNGSSVECVPIGAKDLADMLAFAKAEKPDLTVVVPDDPLALGMVDPNFGWTVEMQVRAAKMGLRCTEIPVSYRQRIGVSKVSGTIRGTLLAGHKILWTIFKLL